MSTALIRALVTVRAVPLRAQAGTVLASALAVAFASSRSWPAWAIVTAAAAPWIPAFSVGTARTYRDRGILALLYVLAIAQTAHFLEHVVQMSQIHVLDRTPPMAHGVFGALDIEWVHFIWNALVFAAAVVVLHRYRQNPFLWAVVAIAAWHVAEHSLMIAHYLQQGTPGHPGFLARGGLISGGLPIARPDLHFLYNLIETVPLVGGLIWQLRRSPLSDPDAVPHGSPS